LTDARNFFAASTEPLHQNQFGVTLGAPIRHNKDFFFAYYEGQRSRQGETATAIVPTAAERSGNFSGLTDSDVSVEPDCAEGRSAYSASQYWTVLVFVHTTTDQ
jgi:hypothetical protein